VLLFGLRQFVWSPEQELCEKEGNFLMYKFSCLVAGTSKEEVQGEVGNK
jgi:hypothetical protein